MKKILCGQFIIILILFLWCTKAWAPFPMTHMGSGEVKVDMPKGEEFIEEETTVAVPSSGKYSKEEKKTQEPAADISSPPSTDAGGKTDGGFFTQEHEPQVEHKTSKTKNKVIEPNAVQEETVDAGKIKITPLRQIILDGVIIIFAVVILLTLIYLSRKGKR